MTDKPFLIIVDGIDGSGKTTIAENIAKITKATYMKATGQGPIGESVRNALLIKENNNNGITVFNWFLAANLETVYNHVMPALKNNKSVVLDRFLSSTYAYAVCRYRGLYLNEYFDQVLDTVMKDISPDLYIWVDVTPETSIERTTTRGNQNHYDKESIDKRLVTINAYREFYNRQEFNKQVKIDGNKPLKEVLESVNSILASCMKKS